MSTNTSNMGLILPTINVDSGLTWENSMNSNSLILDGHNHSPSSGIQINPSGLNINSDLSFQINNAILLRSVRFNPNATTLSGATDLGCIYEAGVDLWYNDGGGLPIRITQSGAVAGTPGSIASLTPPATASYVAANSTFVFQSGVNLPANIDVASIILRNLVSGSPGLTLSPPTLSANYILTLPPLPSVKSIMALDTSGNITAPYTVDNSTIVISSNIIEVPAGGIGTTQLAANSVTTAKIAANAVTSTQIAANAVTSTQIAASAVGTTQLADQSVTQAKRANNPISTTPVVGGVGISPSCSSFTTNSTPANVTNLSVVLTTTGRTVFIGLISDGTGNQASVGCTGPGTSVLGFTQNGTVLCTLFIGNSTSSTFPFQNPVTAFWHVTGVSAGTYTFACRITTAFGIVNVTSAKLIAYEM